MNERVKLFCLPYSGASASFYYSWRKFLSSSIDLVPIELSGHGARISEPLYDSINKITEDAFNSLIQNHEIIDSNYALFGHSAGALICYEILNCLKVRNYQLPKHVFFSGKGAPHISKTEMYQTLPDNQLIERLIELNEDFDSKDNKLLMKLLLPIIRADIKATENYIFKVMEEPLNVDISILIGKRDKYVTVDNSFEWEKYSTKKVNIYEFDGAHLFIHNECESICKLINNTLV